MVETLPTFIRWPARYFSAETQIPSKKTSLYWESLSTMTYGEDIERIQLRQRPGAES